MYSIMEQQQQTQNDTDIADPRILHVLQQAMQMHQQLDEKVQSIKEQRRQIAEQSDQSDSSSTSSSPSSVPHSLSRRSTHVSLLSSLSARRLATQSGEPAVIQSSEPISFAHVNQNEEEEQEQQQIAYYEVTIDSLGEKAGIGVGLATLSHQLHRMPGWDPDSFGYHG